MDLPPLHFIDEPVAVEFDRPPLLEKKPVCPDRFVWREETYAITACLAEWADFARRGRMARNMQPEHSQRAGLRGSRGVGRFFFRVRVADGRIFDLYYDRAPQDALRQKGGWTLYREMDEASPPE